MPAVTLLTSDSNHSTVDATGDPLQEQHKQPQHEPRFLPAGSLPVGSAHGPAATLQAPVVPPRRHVTFDEDANEYYEPRLVLQVIRRPPPEYWQQQQQQQPHQQHQQQHHPQHQHQQYLPEMDQAMMMEEYNNYNSDSNNNCNYFVTSFYWYTPADYQQFRAAVRSKIDQCQGEQRNPQHPHRHFYIAIRNLYLTARKVDFLLENAKELLTNEQMMQMGQIYRGAATIPPPMMSLRRRIEEEQDQEQQDKGDAMEIDQVEGETTDSSSSAVASDASSPASSSDQPPRIPQRRPQDHHNNNSNSTNNNNNSDDNSGAYPHHRSSLPPPPPQQQQPEQLNNNSDDDDNDNEHRAMMNELDSQTTLDLIGMEYHIIASIKKDLRGQRDALQDVVFDVQREYRDGLLPSLEAAQHELQQSCLTLTQSNGLFAQLLALAQSRSIVDENNQEVGRE